MRLSNLLNKIMVLPPDADGDISGLTLDSRRVLPGSLFVALKGAHADGRQYIDAAITNGAIAVLIDADTQDAALEWRGEVPLIPIYHLSAQLGEIAARYYHYPAKKLHMIGVTGTNGKTSCTHFIAQSLQIPCGIIGTLGSGFYGALTDTGFTTPDAITLQSHLQQFVDQGARAVAMEVSSHSIDQGRVNGIAFDIGIFTNLTQDHLDYHGDMETYAGVKKRFLTEMPTKQLIINMDDAYGKKWLAELAQLKPVYAYSIQKPSSLPGDISCTYTDNVKLTLQGIQAEVHSPWGDGELSIPLIGQFNLSNSLAVLSALCVYGIPFKAALTRLSQLHPVEGRMQTLGGHHQPLVVVDYSHTPDSLENALRALRVHTHGKLICVFGCGGDRDQSKRPLMANIAEQLADRVMVTNDNPRHENPEEIARQIMQGFTHPERVSVELDRSKAIQNSIQWASTNDCVLIAGKGAERYQQIGDEKFPFDDVEQVSRYLADN